MRSYLDTGLVNIRHVAKGNQASRAYTRETRLDAMRLLVGQGFAKIR